MCQKDEDGNRTELEQRLFNHAIGNLDVIYAHRGAVSFLSTVLPDGIVPGKTIVPGLEHLSPPATMRGYEDRGWCGFEQQEGFLVKKSEHCLDIGRFSTEEAAATGFTQKTRLPCPPYASKRFVDKTAEELMHQSSYCFSMLQGMLSKLVVGSRGPPLVPAAFNAEVLDKRIFTNGADKIPVAALYKKTAVALLASTPSLEFSALDHWTAADFAQLGAALRMTRALENLELHNMPIDDEGARVLVPTLPRTLKSLKISMCKRITTLPELPPLPSLERLDMQLSSIVMLPDLSGLTSLKMLPLCKFHFSTEVAEAARRQLPLCEVYLY